MAMHRSINIKLEKWERKRNEKEIKRLNEKVKEKYTQSINE